MDIQVFEKDTLKIKIKKTTLAVDPKTPIQKFDADAVLVMDKTFDAKRINGFRVIIDQAGEYEVSGLKISGIKTDGDTMFVFNYDNTEMIVTKSSFLEKAEKDKIGDYQIIVINTDSVLNPSIVTAMEPRVVILYGENAKEGAKALGKENVTKSSKASVVENKLPEELEVIVLG